MKIFNTLSKLNFNNIQEDDISIFPVGKNLYEIDHKEKVAAYFTTDDEDIIISFIIPENIFGPYPLFDTLIMDYNLKLVNMDQFVSYMGSDLTMKNVERTLILLQDMSKEHTSRVFDILTQQTVSIQNGSNESHGHLIPPNNNYTRVYSVVNQVSLERLLMDKDLKIREMGDLLFGMSLNEGKPNLLVFNKNIGLANIIIVSNEEEEYMLLKYLINNYGITLVEYKNMMKHMSICHQSASFEAALFQIGKIVHCETNKILEHSNKFIQSNKSKNNLVDEYNDLPF